MKAFLILIFIYFGIYKAGNAQNLVPNGDFESYIGCPTYWGQLDSASFWFNLSLAGSPDYYNQCAAPIASVPYNHVGYQIAHSGVAYGGVVIARPIFNTNYREYLEVELSDTLIQNSCYTFNMYVSLADTSTHTAYDIGVYFSDTVISGIANFNPLPVLPQINNIVGNYFDTANWILVSAEYVASGNESFIIIGNFKDFANTPTQQIQPVGDNAMAYVYIDDVSLMICDTIHDYVTNAKQLYTEIYPTIFTNELNIKLKNSKPGEIILYDLISKKVLQYSFISSTTLNTSALPNGIYLYEIRNNDKFINRGKLIKEK